MGDIAKSKTLNDHLGSSLTKGARRVLEVLEDIKELCSAQDIHGRLRSADHKAPGLTTVYRSLDALVSLGYVQAVDLGDGEKRYEVVQPGEHHHHLICESCGASQHLDECLLEGFEGTIAKEYGFVINSHVLEIFGTCASCRKGSLNPKT